MSARWQNRRSPDLVPHRITNLATIHGQQCLCWKLQHPGRRLWHAGGAQHWGKLTGEGGPMAPVAGPQTVNLTADMEAAPWPGFSPACPGTWWPHLWIPAVSLPADTTSWLTHGPCQLTSLESLTRLTSESLYLLKPAYEDWKRWLLLQMYRHQGRTTRITKNQANMTL